MSRFNLNQMKDFPHLADILTDVDGHYSPGRLITDFGLYEPAIIDTRAIRVFDKFDGDKPPRIEISPDVKALRLFVMLNENIKLPCAECKDNQAHKSHVTINTKKGISLGFRKRDDGRNRVVVNPFIEKDPDRDESKVYHYAFDPEFDFCSDSLTDFSAPSFQDIDFEEYTDKCCNACIKTILEYASSFQKRFTCYLDDTHNVYADFEVYSVADDRVQELYKRRKQFELSKSADDERLLREAEQNYERLRWCLVIEKVGQYPSMADIQLFDVEKYRTVLKDQFRDLTMALGLHASAVGCGSFVYLRRILENLVEKRHDLIAKAQKWDEQTEEEYSKKRFNEKIEYLENLGEKIIPDDVPELKTLLYGILSKGIHFSSDDLCNQLFPYMKYSIELILDQEIEKREKEKKKKELQKALAAQDAGK